MRLVAALLLIAGAFAAVGFARREDRIRQQKTLAAVASELAGRPVAVRCPGFLRTLVDTHGEAGRVRFDSDGRPANHTDLAPSTCSALRHIDRVDFSCVELGDCGYAQFKVAWAAKTLAHESFHLRGFQDEGITECYALQNTAFVAERLGVATDPARELQAWMYAEGYPNEPQEYRSSDCYDGGPLDLRPRSSAFP
ncbi:MAG: hypothetical protein ACJ74A_00135 [Gaiellaceae bacterium]